MRRFSNYLDADPVRRRVRFAVAVVVVAGVCQLWIPAVLDARSHKVSIVTQKQIERSCDTSTASFLDHDEFCPHGRPVLARDYNAERTYEAHLAVKDALEAPIQRTFALLVTAAVIWILAPLVSPRK